MSYAALYTKSNFSFLEGASHPEQLVETAHKMGLAAIAITSACGCGSPEKVDGGTKVYVVDDPSQGEVRGRSFLDDGEDGVWRSAPSTAEVIEGTLSAANADPAGSMEVGAINPNLAKELLADPG